MFNNYIFQMESIYFNKIYLFNVKLFIVQYQYVRQLSFVNILITILLDNYHDVFVIKAKFIKFNLIF